jgi:hypothetical protein
VVVEQNTDVSDRVELERQRDIASGRRRAVN